MNDNSAHMSNDLSDATQATSKQVTQTNSYVDDYQPPVSQDATSVNDVKPNLAGNAPVNDPVSFDDLIKANVSTSPIPAQEVRDSVEAKDEVAPQASNEVVNDSTFEPAAAPEKSVSAPISNSAASAPVALESIDKPTSSETLEDQNIFSMLGVDDGTEELKENFLNELQQVIWDDFLENDVDLLITSDEKVKFDEIMAKKDKVNSAGREGALGYKTDAGGVNKEADDKIQDALVAYLETLIPDLEDIMLEKALDLKSDLYAERIIGMKEYHANNSENLATVNSAEKMMHEDKWHSSAQLLNKIATE